MSIVAGARLGPYEILAPLGAGGMGEVYRARDTRLDRTVAVKVLPAHLSSSAESRQRFEREAKTISQLSHPHICALYDVGNQDGVEFLVMEYLEGETLSDRLLKGPLAFDQVLRYGIEIADALDKAHRQGIVHRDLKPGNVMITKSGVKLLDFGLAKAIAPAGRTSGASLTALPTQAGTDLTAEGTILGTFQYMAPEQLEGKEADARTDIFAFGAVLYEMATGRKAFSGKSQASLISSIMGVEPPPVSTVAPMTPPAFDRVVRTCLAKDPEDRWQTAHDVMLELKWVAEGGSAAGLPAPVVARRRSRERLAWIVAGILAASTVALGILELRRPRSAFPVVRSNVLPPGKTAFSFVSGGAGPVKISPDGRQLAFVASESGGKRQLWIRPLDSLVARPLPATEGATYPFWSPDGRFVGFFADGKLKRMEVSGGPALTLCDAPDPRGGSWNRDGIILFEPQFREPLYRVTAAGGKPVPVTSFDASRRETTHRWPFFLPDGRHFLYLSGSHSTGAESELDAIFVGSLDGEKPKLLVNARSNAAYAAGHLLFVRQKTLLAQPFDPKRGKLNGEAFPIAENVQDDSGFFNAVFSVSEQGTLAYQEAGGTTGLSELAWVDRSGKKIDVLGDPADYFEPRISPDGRRVAVGVGDPGDIWIYDVARRIRTRLTFAAADDFSSVWSPDGTRVAFSSVRSGAGDLYAKVASGTGADELLSSSKVFKVPNSWSPDGRYLAYFQGAPGSKADLWLLSISDRKASPLLQTEFDEVAAAFSPDGRWLAYASNESGRNEIYVQPFPGPGGKWQVSTAGGLHPRWRRDGKELFYITSDGKVMAVEVRAGAAFESGTPQALFATSLKNAPGPPSYDASADGQRFLLNRPIGEESSPPITLVQNWTAFLNR
ncbi:MAG TPA: protein kinase [Thermoanaerobaculia bacterium]|jgi:serine/threonine protein kinase/Tol biopolymer transport system component|nr:protein kinase [Thermoanaerobaculia bacterium]